MFGQYIMEGLELFKRSQLAIFDKALSLVDLFDSAVSDSVYAMQDIYPHPYYKKEQKYGVWERFLLHLEGCVRHIRLYFFFTVAMLCCTILMLRRRRRNPMYLPLNKLNPDLSPRKPVMLSPSNQVNHKTQPSAVVIENQDPPVVAESQETQETEEDVNSVVKELMGDGEEVSLTQDSRIKKMLEFHNEEKRVVKPKVKTKPKKMKRRRSGSSNALTNIVNRKSVSPVVRVKQHCNKTIPFRRYPRLVRREQCTPQDDDPLKNRAQVFILLNGLDNMTSQQGKRPVSPRKHFSRNSTAASSPKRKNSPFTLTKIPSLRLKKPFRGGGSHASPAIGHDAAGKERQKKKVNIPYLHTISPRRRLPPRAGPHNYNKEMADKLKDKRHQAVNPRKPITGTYLSPKSRMAKSGSETKVNSKIPKRSSGSPNKRCKTCKKIRQYPECMPPADLLPMRNKTKVNIGSLFCFSPQAKLPAPFHNAKINSNGDNAWYPSKKPYPFCSHAQSQYCADTNMNKAVLKFDVQNDNPNNQRTNNACFEMGKSLILSGNNERLNDAFGSGVDSTRYSNCLPCRIQHNVQPVGINEARLKCRSVLKSEVYNNQNESRRQGNCHHISAFPRQPCSRDLYHSNMSHLNSNQPGVRSTVGNPFDTYSGQGMGHGILSQSPLKNFNGRDASFNKWQNNHRIESHSYSLFRAVPQSKFELNNDPPDIKLSDMYRNLKEERFNKYRKRKKEEHSRESRRKCLHEKYSGQLSHPFSLPNEYSNENRGSYTGNETICKNNDDFECEIQSQNDLKYNRFEMDSSDNMSNKHCDKMKSHKWRQRHEPYKCTPTKKKPTTAQSLEDLSHATFTLNTQSSKTTMTRNDDPDFQCQIPNITNLAELARFTASTDTNKDTSSSDVDPTTYSVQSATSYQNKNNCSPSRLAKPFIKPMSEIPIESHPTNVLGNQQGAEFGSQFATNKESINLSFDWQKSGDESKQGNEKDIAYSIGPLATDPFVQEGGIGPTGEGHQQSEFSSPKSAHIELIRNANEFLQSPHSDTKLGSVKRVMAPTQHSYYRPRNKSLRQHRLYNKYPMVASKAVMRAIEQNAPTYSLSGSHSQLGNSVSLGVQTSHTSLRHIAVQTSPQENRMPSGRIPVRLRNKNATPNTNRDVVVTTTYNDVQKLLLNKTHAESSPSQKYFKNVSKPIKQNNDERNSPFVSERKDESSLETLSRMKSEKETSYQIVEDSPVVSNNTRGFRVASGTINNEGDNINIITGKGSTPLVGHIRRESLPILSVSSSTVDVKSDVLVSTSHDTSPSINLLDSNSKDWLTRPKWENANEDEVNRRVERALRLRQELQNYRIAKKPDSPEKKLKTSSLFGQQREEVFSMASTSTFSTENKNDLSTLSIKTVEKKQDVSPLRKNVTIQNVQNINEKECSPIIGILPVRKAESSTTDTLIKTFPFITNPITSFVSENTSTEGHYREVVKYGESATETDGTSETPERHRGLAACAVPNSTEVLPSSATSLSQNTTDSPRVEETSGNVLKDPHQHRHPHLHNPVTKNSPPIKISKMENVIQTEYPKLVGELVQALPHVPLASFVEWFIETSNPGQFISSDESTSTAADAKEVVVKEALSTNYALESTENDRSVIYIRSDEIEDTDHNKYSYNENQRKLNATASISQRSSPEMNDLGAMYKSTQFINEENHEPNSENVDKMSTAEEEDLEGNVPSIKRILLTRKNSSNDSSESMTGNTNSIRKIITLRQTSSDSPFEGNIP